jgi:hypothetical protein
MSFSVSAQHIMQPLRYQTQRAAFQGASAVGANGNRQMTLHLLQAAFLSLGQAAYNESYALLFLAAYL